MKTALVTGASSGFGRSLVTILLQRGWTVVAGLRRLEERRSLFSEELSRHPLHTVELDVTSSSDRQNVAQFIRENFNGLDVLVNNAGVGCTAPFEVLDEKSFREIFESNFFGPTLLTKELLPDLRQSKGKVINVSSILGQVGFLFNSHYCSTKFAMEGWAESLSYELAGFGVQVCLVEPGGFRTSFAQNLISKKLDNEMGVYTKIFSAFKKTWELRLSKPGKDALLVSETLADLCEKSKLPLRTVVGEDAKALALMKKVLPESLRTRLFSHMVSKMERQMEVVQ